MGEKKSLRRATVLKVSEMPKKKKKESLKEKRRRAALKRERALKSERIRIEREIERRHASARGKIYRRIFVVICLVVLVLVSYSVWQSMQTSTPSSTEPQPTEPTEPEQPPSPTTKEAPLFTLTDIDGKTFSLGDFKGKVVVLDFFYIRCPYCDDQILELKEIYESYSHDNVEIISISIDPAYDTIDRLKEFKTGPNQFSSLNYEISWTLTRDTNEVATKYGISAAPTTVIIDEEGFISPHSPFIGLTDASQLTGEIDVLLNR
jgi:cytochrome oxidase Cu insertion factor (SCO1/SenC/PrrC family)